MNLTRRDFAKLSTLALATRLVQNLHAGTSAPRKTGYCVIGLGRIAGHFMPAVRNTTTSQVTGLVSGHRDKAERIAAQYGVPPTSIYNYENFDEIARNSAIDAVYVALPNSMHSEYTIRAAKAGKHVLCEKPMSTDVATAEAMIAACKAARVKLMVAYRCQYEPTNLKAIRLIRQGALGQVQATFLSTINGGRKIEAFPKKQTVFAQGDSSDAVFYIQEGRVKLTVVSKIGKEATIGILNKGDFFGEGCLTG